MKHSILAIFPDKTLLKPESKDNLPISVQKHVVGTHRSASLTYV